MIRLDYEFAARELSENRRDWARFWSKLELDGSCWIWAGCRNEKGYGYFNLRRKNYRAHRLAYASVCGVPDESLEMDHMCGNRACCNPAHLEPVTGEENRLRSNHHNTAKTHCKHGHEFTSDNTRIRPSGHRECRTCARAGHRRAWARRKSRVNASRKEKHNA